MPILCAETSVLAYEKEAELSELITRGMAGMAIIGMDAFPISSPECTSHAGMLCPVSVGHLRIHPSFIFEPKPYSPSLDLKVSQGLS